MEGYVERMINYFPMKVIKSDTYLIPVGNNLFFGNSKRLGKKTTKDLHTSIARGFFVVKKSTPDIHQTAKV